MPDDAPSIIARAPGPFAVGLAALRRFWRPFVLIQSVAIGLALAYRFSAAVRAVCVVLARWKTAGGLPFAAIVGAVAGGLLPELAKWLVARPQPPTGTAGPDARRARARARRDVLFNAVVFAVNAVLVDELYRTAARLFGSDARLPTIVRKIAFDQFVFTPTTLSLTVALFLLRQRGWSWARTRPALGRGFLSSRVMPVLVPAWCFWIPIVAIVYALPGPLQFVMFAFALAAWSLIMVFIANDRARPDASGAG